MKNDLNIKLIEKTLVILAMKRITNTETISPIDHSESLNTQTNPI